MAKVDRVEEKPAPAAPPAAATTNGQPDTPPKELPRTKMDVWQYMRSLTAGEWEQHMAYLYRVEPKLMKVEGSPDYLDRFKSAFDQDFIKQKYGGGVFKIILNKGDSTVRTVVFGVEGKPHAVDGRPFLEPAEDTGKGGQLGGNEYIRRHVNFLEARLAEAEAKGEQLDPTATIQQGYKIITDAASRAVEFIVSQTPRQTSITELISGLAKLDEMRSGRQGVSALGEIAEVLKAVTPLLGQRGPAGTLGEFRELLGLIKELGLGGGGAEGGDWKSVLAQHASEAIKQLKEMVQEWRGIAHENRLIEENRAALKLAERGVVVQPTREPVPVPAPAPIQRPVVETEPIQPSNEQIAADRLIKQNIVLIVETGGTGAQAAAVLDQLAPQVLDYLLGQKPDELTAIFAADPTLQRVAKHPRLPDFIKEFLAEGETVPEAQPASVQ